MIKKLLDLLTPPERKRAGLLLGMIGVASIMPFMAVLANPEIIETNAMLNAVYQAAGQHLGIATTEQFLFALGMLAFKALTTYAQLRFTLMREYSIGKRLVEGYLLTSLHA